MAARYTVESAGDIALVGATPKTVLSYINAANGIARITCVVASFDGTSATAEPVTVELCYSTQAGAGSSTAHTMLQVGGPTRTVQGTAARAFSSEPTTLTTWYRWLVRADGGLLIHQFPLGREPEITVTADAICLRCTAPVGVNFVGTLELEEG